MYALNWTHIYTHLQRYRSSHRKRNNKKNQQNYRRTPGIAEKERARETKERTGGKNIQSVTASFEQNGEGGRQCDTNNNRSRNVYIS